MSGHSKWNNIKNRKGAVDAQRAKVFSLAAKAIRVAVKEGKSADPKANNSLRLALEKARAANMPKDKIQRAIDTGLGKRDGKSIQEMLYEGFGPGGVGVMIAAVTDNPQRTAAEIRLILSRHQGNLGGPGSAQYLFTKQGVGEYVPSMDYTVDDPATVALLQDMADELNEHDDVEDVFWAARWESE